MKPTQEQVIAWAREVWGDDSGKPWSEAALLHITQLATLAYEAGRKDENGAATALRARLAQPEQEIDPDRPHVEDDGCPTEKAVLQRFWREHQAQPERKLWLWKNFVDGRPEYWAFDNPYPTNLDNGDPQTLGQPCGYAIFKPSRDGSRGRTEEQVLREMESVSARSEREWQGLTDEEYEAMAEKYVTNYFFDTLKYAKAIEAKLKEKNT